MTRDFAISHIIWKALSLCIIKTFAVKIWKFCCYQLTVKMLIWLEIWLWKKTTKNKDIYLKVFAHLCGLFGNFITASYLMTFASVSSGLDWDIRVCMEKCWVVSWQITEMSKYLTCVWSVIWLCLFLHKYFSSVS